MGEINALDYRATSQDTERRGRWNQICFKFHRSTFEQSENNEPMTFKRIAKPLWDALPDFMPTGLQPIFECAANYDLFTNAPVVPYRLQGLPENLQFDSRTSWAAKKLVIPHLQNFSSITKFHHRKLNILFLDIQAIWARAQWDFSTEQPATKK